MKSSRDVRVALDALRRIVRALRVAGRNGDGGAGISHAQLFALQRIAEHPDASINEVAALTFTHQSSVSVVVQRLVRRRLVAKVPATDDRRRQRLVVTALGRRLLAQAPAAVPERIVVAISALRPADRRAFAASIDRIADAVSPPGGSPPMFLEDRLVHRTTSSARRHGRSRRRQ